MRLFTLFIIPLLSVLSMPQGHALANSEAPLWVNFVTAYSEVHAPCTFPARGEALKYDGLLQRLYESQTYVEEIYGKQKVSGFIDQHEEELTMLICSGKATFDLNFLGEKVEELEKAIGADQKNREE